MTAPTSPPGHSNAPTADPNTLRVLIVEDSEDDAALLVAELQRGGHQVSWQRVDCAAALTAALAERPWDLVISDYALPQFSGIEALTILQKSGLDLPFVLVSGVIGEDAAVAAMKAGAHDFIVKGHLARLAPAIERELREAEMRRERRAAEEALREEAAVSHALAQVGHELIGSFGTPALLDRLCLVTATVLGCDSAYTLLWRPEEDVYTIEAGYGAMPEELQVGRLIKVPRELMAAVLSRLEHADVAMADAIPERALSAERQQQYGVAAQLCMALRRHNEILGLQTAGYRHRVSEPFTPRQWRIARGIAQLASLALEHARLLEELTRASRLKSEFVATMSHELRSPLNIIMGYSDLLREGDLGPLTPEQADALDRMDRTSRQLLDLINATLDLNRLEAGRLPLDITVVQVPALLHELDAETRELQDRSGLRFVWNVSPELPEVRTDRAKLKTVLRNLIGNAVKFTERGSVTIGAAPRDGGCDISVSDTGIGIAPEAVPIIFEPFRQVDSSMTRHHGGVGLGLYITRRLLDVLGGAISVDTEAGRGSTFRVWVPAEHKAETG